MKFLCVSCDQQMIFEQRRIPGDGTMAAAFRCPDCERIVAMLTNPMETQLVSSLGIEVGGKTVPQQPLEMVRGKVKTGRDDAFVDGDARPTGAVAWSVDAVERLESVPRFVRGMVKRIYTDYAKEHGIPEITPAIMDRARSDLGLEGM